MESLAAITLKTKLIAGGNSEKLCTPALRRTKVALRGMEATANLGQEVETNLG